MNADDQKRLWDGLLIAEQVAGDELRQSVGQALDRLMRDGLKNEIVPMRTLKARAMALAWIASPEAFGGRTLRQVLGDVK